MNGRDFFTAVANHANIEWLGAKQGSTPSEDLVYVADTKRKCITAFLVCGLEDHNWEALSGVALSTRPAKVMRQLARIVGYYSELQNWNGSKIAELNDRHNGNYGLAEPAVVRAAVAA